MSVANISKDSFLFLNHASGAFKENDTIKAKVSFEAAGDLKNKVFERMWINRGRPMGNPRYGEYTFYDQYGYYSTNFEKAKAIDDFVSFAYILEAKETENVRMIYNYPPLEQHFKKQDDRSDINNMYKNQENFEKFTDKVSPLPAHCEIPAKYACIGVAGCSLIVLVADAVRKAMGYS